jgi:hypothetical protein
MKELTIDEVFALGEESIMSCSIVENVTKFGSIEFEFETSQLILSDTISRIPTITKAVVPDEFKDEYDDDWKEAICEAIASIFSNKDVNKFSVRVIYQLDVNDPVLMFVNGSIYAGGKIVHVLGAEESMSIAGLFSASLPSSFPLPPSLWLGLSTKNKELVENVCKKIGDMPSYMSANDYADWWIVFDDEYYLSI